MQEIYRTGGRKFGFLNLGPLGCFPGLRILKPEPANGSRESSSSLVCFDEEVSLLAKLHNKQLFKSLSRMKKHFPDFKYTIFDFHTFLRKRIINPVRYGNWFKSSIILLPFHVNGNEYIYTAGSWSKNQIREITNYLVGTYIYLLWFSMFWFRFGPC